MDVEALPTCYRHPDRETRLACSQCDRPVCVDCVRAAPVGQKCVECATPEGRNRVITAAEIRSGPSLAATPVSLVILVACVGLFALGFLVPPVGNVAFGLLAQGNAAVDAGQWWRVLTAAFLHGSLLHVGFNMYALYIFGPPLERDVGSVAFGLFYAAAAIAGGSAYFLLGDPRGVAVGASGAIFGLFGVWLASAYRERGTIAGQANLRQLGMLLAINLALPLLPGSRIAWQAHLGGLAVGFLIGLIWSAAARGRAGGRLRAGVATAVGVVALLPVLLG